MKLEGIHRRHRRRNHTDRLSLWGGRRQSLWDCRVLSGADDNNSPGKHLLYDNYTDDRWWSGRSSAGRLRTSVEWRLLPYSGCELGVGWSIRRPVAVTHGSIGGRSLCRTMGCLGHSTARTGCAWPVGVHEYDGVQRDSSRAGDCIHWGISVQDVGGCHRHPRGGRGCDQSEQEAASRLRWAAVPAVTIPVNCTPEEDQKGPQRSAFFYFRY